MKPDESTLAMCQRRLRADCTDFLCRFRLKDWLLHAGDDHEAKVQELLSLAEPRPTLGEAHYWEASRYATSKGWDATEWEIEFGWEPDLCVWVYRPLWRQCAGPWLICIEDLEHPELSWWQNEAGLSGHTDVREARSIRPKALLAHLANGSQPKA